MKTNILKATPFPHPSRREGSGFALVIALGLMSFVTLVVMSIATLVSIELKHAEMTKAKLLARENARLGVMVALGNLQRYAGPDRRVTARAEGATSPTPESSKWLGVWDSSSGSPSSIQWLVSGADQDPITGTQDPNPATLFPGVTGASPVMADWIPTEEQNSPYVSRFAYWVEDESMKARINMSPDTLLLDYLGDSDERQNIEESIRRFPAQEKIFSAINPDLGISPPPIDTLRDLSKLVSRGQVDLVLPNQELLREKHHDFTIYSATVLENPLIGGLKTNLTGRTADELEILLTEPDKVGDTYLNRDFLLHYNIDPETGLPFTLTANPNNPDSNGGSIASNGDLVRAAASDFFTFRSESTDYQDDVVTTVRNIMPIISEASFRLGAFHTQTDTKHRIRFHADVEFWNPYPFPIRFPGEGSSRCFVVMLVPSQLSESGRGRGAVTDKMILSVQKMTGGRGRGSSVESEFHTNLFNFDEDLGSVLGGGSTNNSIDETVMSSWMVIDDVVLQPGEVYHATTEKSDGLARDLGGFVLGPGGDEDNANDYVEDPTHHYHKWSWHTTENPTHPVILAPGDEVRVDLRMPPNGLTMRLIPFNSQSQSRTPVYEEEDNEWAKPVFEIRHLYKGENPPTLVLSGSEYSRSSSGSYTEDNYNIGFHYRLDDEAIVTGDPDASAMTLGFDLRQPVWDYDNPAVKRLIMVGGIYPEEAAAGIEPDPFDTNALANLFYDGVDILADSNPDTHFGGYERAILYNVPTSAPLSVGSFSNLPLSYETVDYDVDGDGNDEPVQRRFGAPWADALNQAFDRYFFSGAPESEWNTDLPLPVPAVVTEGATNASLREADASKDLLVEGGFNINSLSPEAWAAVISRTIYNWKYNSNQTIDLQNAFLNLGDSTDDAVSINGDLIEDKDFTNFDVGDLNAPVEAGRIAMRYPLRRLSDEQLYNPVTPEPDSLVEFIVSGLQDRLTTEPPFASVSEFINSGILEEAIRESDINGNVARFSPAYICQSKLLEGLAPYLNVRGDTFVIRSMGNFANVANAGGSSSVVCEAVVQRLPNRVDGDLTRITDPASDNGNSFGRRFVILRMSWKDSI